MNSFFNLAMYIVIGTLGGYFGTKLKLPSGALMGSMLAIIFFKLLTKINWNIPGNFDFVVQVLLGVVLGCSFYPEMLKTLNKVMFPIMSTTLVITIVGLLLALIFVKFGFLDFQNAYLSTSPGAMTAILGLAIDNKCNLPVIICFHFFRVIFIIVTAPFIIKYLAH